MRKEALAAVIAILVVASLGIGYLSGSTAAITKTITSTASETTLISFPPPISITHTSTSVAATTTGWIISPCNCTDNMNEIWQSQTYSTMQDLASHSTAIIVGTLTSERVIGVNDSFLFGHIVGLVPVTDYNVTIIAVLADDGNHFGIDISAGYWTIVPQIGGTFGQTTMNVTGYPTLDVGMSYVFFLTISHDAPIEGNLYNGLATTGGSQGLFYIQGGNVYSLDNMYPQADSWLPVKADGVPLARFVQQVQSALASSTTVTSSTSSSTSSNSTTIIGQAWRSIRLAARPPYSGGKAMRFAELLSAA